jgi:prepilin-type N-terminal cleavage/methylation domain-containing protein
MKNIQLNHKSKITNHKYRKGFTFGELVVVMAIIALVAAMGINTYGKQRELTKFNDALSKTLSMIQTARTYASTSMSAYDSTGTNLIVPPEGYGVYIDKAGKKITLFANVKAGTEMEKNRYDEGAGGDTVEETYTLPDNMIFDAIITDPESLAENFAVIFFRPPLADVTITNNDATSLEQINTLSLQFSRVGTENIKKVIKINKTAGFPEIEL